MKRQFSRFQIVCITLLWAALCYIVLTTAERIDGPIILTLIIFSGIGIHSCNKSAQKEINNIFLFIFTG